MLSHSLLLLHVALSPLNVSLEASQADPALTRIGAGPCLSDKGLKLTSLLLINS